MATTFGHKGGESPTAGKRSETLRSPSTGMTKRVFKGQRWLVIAQMDEDAVCDILAFDSEETAKHVSNRCHDLGCEVHYVERAEVLA